MARTWWSIEVELVAGRGQYHWPRPGRIFAADPTFTFRQLADAINGAFSRWERSHLHQFVLEDGTEVLPLAWWEEAPDTALDDDATDLSVLAPGDRFAYEFDLGDGWEHLCTVGPKAVDPYEVLGIEPDEPLPYFGWGDIPDQHGRRWRDDDGSGDVPPPPEPPLSDLPVILARWGR